MNLFLRLLLLMFRVRSRRDLGIWDTARTRFRVNPMDLDVLGHMNNGRFLSIMDLARMDLMIRSGTWKQFTARGWTPVVAGQTITYFSSLTLGTSFDVDSRVLGYDERWLYLQQVFRRQEKLVAHAVVRARLLRREGGTVDVAEVIDLLGEAPDGREVPEWVQEWTEASSRSAKALR